ncbi:MAG: hypothetical protein VYB65_01020 [Myxococcota bacterium]|nr:hypothetical protein [Myxococcota bacterium]
MTAWILSSLLAAAPPAADAAAAVPAKPPVRLLNRDLGGGLSASVRIQPGVPEAGQVARVIIEVAKKGPAGPVPLNGATMTARIAPNTKGTKDRKLRRKLSRVKPFGRKVQALKDRGSYGFHATLPTAGSYKVAIEGEYKGSPVSFEFGLYPNLWPAPDLQAEEALMKSGRSRRPLRRR